MKNFKKVTAAIAATLMAATMVAPMALNAFADDDDLIGGNTPGASENENPDEGDPDDGNTTPPPVTGDSTTITVKDAANRTFKAYQLMTAVVSADNKNITYTVNDTYSDILKGYFKVDSDAKVIEALEKITSNSDEMRAFADAVYASVKDMTADVAEGEFTSGAATVGFGYYLVVDTTTGLGDDVRSKVMVDTADRTGSGVTIELKKTKPTFEKKIWDTNDTKSATGDAVNDGTVDLNELTGWQDSADHDMGDKVPFKLTATLPEDINLYDDYGVAFHDTLDTGSWEFNEDSVKIYLGETEVTDLFKVDTEKTADTFVIYDLTDNIMDNNWTLKGGDTIDVYYTATLTKAAVVGNPGNWNKAKLEYTNDYYWDSDGKYGEGDDEGDKTETSDDWVVAFTYQTVVDKIDGDKEDLTGATFSLWKKNASGEWDKLETIAGTSASKFEFKGIDDGDYKIVEDNAPEGYSKAADIEFTVTAEHSETVKTKADKGILTKLESSNTKLTASLESATIAREKTGATHAAASGELYTEVINQSGSKLPSTGGIGTTLFYLGGGAMVAVAGVFLITKKRMKKEEV